MGEKAKKNQYLSETTTLYEFYLQNQNIICLSRGNRDTTTAPLSVRGGWVYSIGLINDEKNEELFRQRLV